MRATMVAHAERVSTLPSESRVTSRLRPAIALISAATVTQIASSCTRNGDSTEQWTLPRTLGAAAIAASGRGWISLGRRNNLVNCEERRTQINGQGVNLAFTVAPDERESVRVALHQSGFGATAGGSGCDTSEDGKEGKSSGHWRMVVTRRRGSRRENPTRTG